MSSHSMDYEGVNGEEDTVTPQTSHDMAIENNDNGQNPTTPQGTHMQVNTNPYIMLAAAAPAAPAVPAAVPDNDEPVTPSVPQFRKPLPSGRIRSEGANQQSNAGSPSPAQVGSVATPANGQIPYVGNTDNTNSPSEKRTLGSILTASDIVAKKRRKIKSNGEDESYRPSHKVDKPAPGEPLRRSQRIMLAKPATTFEVFFKALPKELQLRIWALAGADANRRCVFLPNRSAYNTRFHDRVHNTLPAVFHACTNSREMAMKGYKKMFARIFHETPRANTQVIQRASQASVFTSHNHARPHVDPKLFPPAPALQAAPYLDYTNWQFVNPDKDIVLYEPCNIGCRAHHCARGQFTQGDREAVRYLAVRIEVLEFYIEQPIWVTATRSWPNIEVLYLIVNEDYVDWDKRTEWALLRSARGPQEILLYHEFKAWKEADNSEPGMESGRDLKIRDIEFVRVVPHARRADGQTLSEQYPQLGRWREVVEDDVIIG